MDTIFLPFHQNMLVIRLLWYRNPSPLRARSGSVPRIQKQNLSFTESCNKHGYGLVKKKCCVTSLSSKLFRSDRKTQMPLLNAMPHLLANSLYVIASSYFGTFLRLVYKLWPPVSAVEVIESEPCFCVYVCLSICPHSHGRIFSKSYRKHKYFFLRLWQKDCTMRGCTRYVNAQAF